MHDGTVKKRKALAAPRSHERVVGPAQSRRRVQIMTNAALTGATYDVDGGQQFTA